MRTSLRANGFAVRTGSPAKQDRVKMVVGMNKGEAATADTVLDLLRRLPPRERLRVIAQALPEVERDLSESPRPLKSLRGLWKDLNFDISAQEIDQARREAWANFPREDF